MSWNQIPLYHLKNNFESFSDKEKAVLNYALKINDSANKTISDDHKILKDFGYDDKQIVEITSVVAAFNWANIIADALGTEIESWLLNFYDKFWSTNQFFHCFFILSKFRNRNQAKITKEHEKKGDLNRTGIHVNLGINFV